MQEVQDHIILPANSKTIFFVYTSVRGKLIWNVRRFMIFIFSPANLTLSSVGLAASMQKNCSSAVSEFNCRRVASSMDRDLHFLQL